MKKTFWIRPIFLDDDWRCLRRSRLLTVDMSAELEVHYIYIFWLIGMSFSSRRRNYLLTSHRRDGLIEWYAHQKCTSAVLCGYPVLVTVGICTVSQVALTTRAFRCGEWGRNRGARGTVWGTWWASLLVVPFAKWILLWTADIHPGTKRNEFCWCQVAGWQQNLAWDTLGRWSSTQISASTFGCSGALHSKPLKSSISVVLCCRLKRSMDAPSSRRPISIISSTV